MYFMCEISRPAFAQFHYQLFEFKLHQHRFVGVTSKLHPLKNPVNFDAL